LGGNFLQEAAIRFASNGWAPLHKKNYSIKGVDSHFLHYRNTVRRVEYQGGARERRVENFCRKLQILDLPARGGHFCIKNCSLKDGHSRLSKIQIRKRKYQERQEC
jgi:hypothetical protein